MIDSFGAMIFSNLFFRTFSQEQGIELVDTIHSNYRQVVLSSTMNFLLVFTLNGLPELGSSFKEIFLVAPFENKSKIDSISSYSAFRIYWADGNIFR